MVDRLPRLNIAPAAYHGRPYPIVGEMPIHAKVGMERPTAYSKMGYIFLSAALIVSLLIAATAPRLGLILGGILSLIGVLPAILVLVSNLVFGAQVDESAGMVIMLWLFFAGAPGVFLLVISLVFIASDL